MSSDNLPTMASSAHAHTSYAAGELGGMAQVNRAAINADAAFRRMPIGGAVAQQIVPSEPVKPGVLAMVDKPARRLVKVLIADPNDNIPLENCLLYSGEETLTDATDQELFFELDIKGLLEKHNTVRTGLVNKTITDRAVNLEPAKVRDLKMVVVTIANL